MLDASGLASVEDIKNKLSTYSTENAELLSRLHSAITELGKPTFIKAPPFQESKEIETDEEEATLKTYVAEAAETEATETEEVAEEAAEEEEAVKTEDESTEDETAASEEKKDLFFKEKVNF